MRKTLRLAAAALALAPLLGGCDLIDKDRGWKNDAAREWQKYGEH